MSESVRLENPTPCPFCGSTWILIGYKYAAICNDCGATGPDSTKQGGAIRQATNLWNLRAGLQDPPLAGGKSEIPNTDLGAHPIPATNIVRVSKTSEEMTTTITELRGALDWIANNPHDPRCVKETAMRALCEWFK